MTVVQPAGGIADSLARNNSLARNDNLAAKNSLAGKAGGTLPPQAAGRSALFDSLRQALPKAGWALVSVGLFAGLWELLWALGISDPRLLPPPHIFLGHFAEQAKFFNTAQRWQVGVNPNGGPSPTAALLITVLSSAGRVFAGLLIASVLSITLGVLIRYYRLVERLVLPTVTMLSPVSPIAWLPVAIFMFGIGNAPAIFMVVVALFFHMVLSTVNQIDGVNKNLINVARTMGATKPQIYWRVIIPAILPGLLVVLRLNLFGAWMVVLVAESTGVGYGLGQVIMLARNTFNPSLVFFTIALIGLLGFLSDWIMRWIQRRVLYWVPQTSQVLNGL
jgi:NitT/TauT family transport system permease protein